MKTLFKRIFIHNWQRKLIALLTSFVIWLLVNYTITVTRTIPNVPIQVVNIPKDKTIERISPKKITLVVTGKRSVVEKITSADLEVVTDASSKGDDWTFEVSKRNLKGTTPDIDIRHGVNQVSPVDISVRLSPLVTEKVPITITQPIGESPNGYLYLDIWPQRLTQTVSGPEPKVRELKEKGLRLTLNLNRITKEDLDQIFEKDEDEIRFFIPNNWKKVHIPFETEQLVAINDPESAFLHIDFLKRESLALDADLQVDVFFPLPYSLTLNPDTYSLGTNGLLTTKNGIPILNMPLYVRNVSRQFLDTVRNQMQLTFTALPTTVGKTLPWSVQFIDPAGLEDRYVKNLIASYEENEKLSPKRREEVLRSRFRKYMREFEFLDKEGKPLVLRATLGAETIRVIQEES